MTKKEQFKIEINLIVMLMELSLDCMLYLGIDERYVIVDVPFKGQFGLGRIVDCNHIHRIIKESGSNKLSPKEVFKRMCEERWLDDVE